MRHARPHGPGPRWCACLALLWPFTALCAQEPAATTMSELASRADLVALAQVADTDYQYTRSFPSGGTAFLRVMIPYKVTRPYGELIEVYEEGLHEHECYFPTPALAEEGRRFLVFLRLDPERPARFRGMATGCALDVLVTADNGYALRWPADGIDSLDLPEAPVVALSFSDQHAFVEDETLRVETRNAWIDGGWLRQLDDGRYVFTHGIPLQAVRGLIGAENLTQDRNLLRPESE